MSTYDDFANYIARMIARRWVRKHGSTAHVRNGDCAGAKAAPAGKGNKSKTPCQRRDDC